MLLIIKHSKELTSYEEQEEATKPIGQCFGQHTCVWISKSSILLGTWTFITVFSLGGLLTEIGQSNEDPSLFTWIDQTFCRLSSLILTCCSCPCQTTLSSPGPYDGRSVYSIWNATDQSGITSFINTRHKTSLFVRLSLLNRREKIFKNENMSQSR